MICQGEPPMPTIRPVAVAVAALLAIAAGSGVVQAAPGDQRVTPLPPAASGAAPAKKSAVVERAASLPAAGLFEGDKLSAKGKAQLTDLILNALGLRIEVALVVPTGPWRLDGSGADERDLSPARLDAVKRFMAERGVDPGRIYVESRIDQSAREPRLDVQLMGREATD
jgi:OOP family OmpA-OmpF porin